MAGARRFVVPWWSEAQDGHPAGEAATSVELPGEITHGLVITNPFGPGTTDTLAIHAVRETSVITLAIGHLVQFDYQPVRPRIENQQSGANRAPRTQADGFADDGD